MKILTNFDMALNQIMQLVLEKLAADPATATQGRIYYNTTTDEIKYADGTNWNTFASDMTAAQILAALLTVDGPGSNLDADTVDGLQASAFALVGHTHSASQITDFNAVVDSRIMAAFTNDAVDATTDTIAEFTQLIKDNEGNIAAIVSTKKFQLNLGNGTLTTIPVPHNLASLDVQVDIIEVATGETVVADVVRADINNINVIFAVAPTADQYRAVILG